MWINNHLMHVIGDTVFAVRVLNIISGDERVVALDQPARCVTTRRPVVRGWAGEINSRSVTALGIANVVGNIPDRIELQLLEQKHDLRDALTRLGYAELIEDLDRKTTGRTST